MDTRQQIIEQLNKPAEVTGLYDQLKGCLSLDVSKYKSIFTIEEGIDNWFKGVIESLYYRPNHYCLVLVGKARIGKTEFFRRLLPFQQERDHRGIKISEYYNETWASLDLKMILFSHLIVQFEFTTKSLDYPNEDNFTVVPSVEDILEDGTTTELRKGYADKRLASYCSTTNKWIYPQRKNYTIVYLDSIDQEAYNKINKLDLWIEIFNMFKPEGK